MLPPGSPSRSLAQAAERIGAALIGTPLNLPGVGSSTAAAAAQAPTAERQPAGGPSTSTEEPATSPRITAEALVESLAAAAEEAVPQTGDLAAPGVAVAAAGVRWLQDTVPFCGLLLVVFLQQHLLPILAFSWCTFVLHHANARVRLWLPLLQAPPGGAGVLLVAAEIVTQLLALLLLCGRDLVSQLLLRLPDWALNGATLFGVLLAVLSADVVVRFVGTNPQARH